MPRDLSSFLGQSVTLVIDRPLGSVHPRHPDLVYPINYGYVPATVSGDAMAVDGYLLGVDKPVETAEGVVIARIVRADDAEDKLVIAPVGENFTAEQIEEWVTFQERLFESRVVMGKESKQ